jgi:exopolysaccharide biosynthesis polyprenyl glycosylphosphotransferase
VLHILNNSLPFRSHRRVTRCTDVSATLAVQIERSTDAGRAIMSDAAAAKRKSMSSDGYPAWKAMDPCPVEQGGFSRLWRRRGSFLFCFDIAICIGSFIGAYYLRFQTNGIAAWLFPPFSEIPPLGPYINATLLTTALWVFLLARESAYGTDLYFLTGFEFQVRLVLVSGFYSLVFLFVISFIFRQMLLSRIVYLLGFSLACPLMLLVRFGFSRIDKRLASHCVTIYRVLLLGWNRYAGTLLDRLRGHNQCTEVIGRLDWGILTERSVDGPSEIPVIGTVHDLEEIYAKEPFDQLIVVTQGQGLDHGNPIHREPLVHALNFCEARGISFYMVPDYLDVAVQRRELGTFSGIPLIRLRDSALHPIYAAIKRLLDVVVASAVLVIGSPIWIIIALFIKMTSKGPVFYIQERVGLHGRPFPMYKFRSMVEDADRRLKELIDFESMDEPVFNIRRDPRVTAIGRILRRTSLDEIPQLLNVIAGNMSLIGPRPERVELVERYTPSQRRRLKAKPGITGYQQVMSRGDPSLAKRIEYDLYYLKFQSLYLDIYILLKTILVVVRGGGMK